MKDAAVRRTAEIEDPTNLYFIHPISARLVPIFARAGITPNMVSLTGMGCGLLAGLCYYFYREIWCDLAGFALMLTWHVMDGADGQLARATKTYSDFGKVLDGICDYVTFAAVYLGLGLALSQRSGVWVLAVVALSAVCHAVQSAAYELQRENYEDWSKEKGLRAQPGMRTRAGGAGWRMRAAATAQGVYARIQLLAAGGVLRFNQGFAAIVVEAPSAKPALLTAYRAQFAPMIRRWGVLCSNYRTLGIFVAALTGWPLLYFYFEICGFSLVLLILLRAQNRANASFLQQALLTVRGVALRQRVEA
jgi:phosphatidylglycerophosphate synthase